MVLQHRMVTVKVHYGEIAKLFAPGGMVRDDATQAQRAILITAEMSAPRRSGVLRGSHLNIGFLQEGPYRIVGRVRNVADHALFVHEGTKSPLAPGKMMKVPVYKGAPNFFIASPRRIPPIRGQKANPWLARASELVIRSRGY
jgi:hypothetical protein